MRICRRQVHPRSFRKNQKIALLTKDPGEAPTFADQDIEENREQYKAD